MKLVRWPLMGSVHLVQRGGALEACSPTIPLLAVGAVPNVSAHPSTASVPVTVLLYNGPFLCGFNNNNNNNNNNTTTYKGAVTCP